MITQIKTESAKKVPTYDSDGKENGFLMELFKDGDKTAVYLSAAKSGAFKGYHLHKVRAARYICLKGTMKIILYINKKRQEYILHQGDRLYIPNNTPTGLENIGAEEAWLINYPDPPYDPSLVGEQIDFTQEDLDRGKIQYS